MPGGEGRVHWGLKVAQCDESIEFGDEERCYVSPKCEGLVIKEHIKNLGLYPKVNM